MHYSTLALSAIVLVTTLAGCRREGGELQNWTKVGHAWRLIGTPGQPRAIIRIEEKPPHTILITQGRFLDSALGTTQSGDVEIILLSMGDAKERKIIQIPTGRAAVIQDSGTLTLLDPGAIVWDGQNLEWTQNAISFESLLQDLTEKNAEQ